MSEPAISTPDPSTPDIRIVLVGTQHPGNIGAAARAMKTMGLSQLVLVAPEKAPDRDTEAMAAGADRYVVKGGSMRDLLDVIPNVLHAA